MKTSKKFHERFREVMVEYHEQSDALDKKFDALIADEISAERTQLETSSKPEYPIGTRVWCPKQKRLGTLVEVEVEIDVADDDYYADRNGPGRYDMGFCDETYGELARPKDFPHGSARWCYTVQPDPSPVLKLVASTYQALSIEDDDEGRLIASPGYRW